MLMPPMKVWRDHYVSMLSNVSLSTQREAHTKQNKLS